MVCNPKVGNYAVDESLGDGKSPREVLGEVGGIDPYAACKLSLREVRYADEMADATYDSVGVKGTRIIGGRDRNHKVVIYTAKIVIFTIITVYF